MSEMTDLQQSAAHNRKLTAAFRRYQCGDTNEEFLSLVAETENCNNAHADDPAWFPVKFKKGDWVCVGTCGPEIVVEVITAESVRTRNLDGCHTRYNPTCLTKLNDRKLGEAAKRCGSEWLGERVREHFTSHSKEGGA